MNYCIATATDVGTTRKVNQDCLWVGEFCLKGENTVCAVLCDGMGGLQHGEVASAAVVAAFEEWARLRLPELEFPLMDHVIREEWTKLALAANRTVQAYGEENGCVLGSTLTALLLTGKRYYIVNVGDSRAYEIDRQARRITVDHTVAEDEVSRGVMTPEEAQTSSKQSVLTRCIGVKDSVIPDMFFGDTVHGAVYMLCSDGFRHLLSPEEIRRTLLESAKGGAETLEQGLLTLIEANKQRGERDNISAIAIFTQGDQT